MHGQAESSFCGYGKKAMLFAIEWGGEGGFSRQSSSSTSLLLADKLDFNVASDLGGIFDHRDFEEDSLWYWAFGVSSMRRFGSGRIHCILHLKFGRRRLPAAPWTDTSFEISRTGHYSLTRKVAGTGCKCCLHTKVSGSE
jgi:hypothetical protein